MFELLLEGNSYTKAFKTWAEKDENKKYWNRQYQTYQELETAMNNALRPALDGRDHKLQYYWTKGVCRIYLTEILGDADLMGDYAQYMEAVCYVILRDGGEDSKGATDNSKDFNGKTWKQIQEVYGSRVLQWRQENDKINIKKTNKTYYVKKISNYESLLKYEYLFKDLGRYKWCLYDGTGSRFKHYTANGKYNFYLCLRSDCEELKPIGSKDSPLDDYGLSVFAVIVTPTGCIDDCTSRWNYKYSQSMKYFLNRDKEKIAEVLNIDPAKFYETFAPISQYEEFEKMFNSYNVVAYKNKNIIIKTDRERSSFAVLSAKSGYPFGWYNRPDGTKFENINSEEAKKHRMTLKFIYDNIGQFVDGRALFISNNKFGYLDELGKEIIPAEFDFAKDFESGIAIVSKDRKYGIINQNGEVVIPFDYDCIESANQNGFTAKKGDYWGIFDKYGKEIIPCEYTSIGIEKDGRVTVHKGDKMGIIDMESKKMIFDCIYDDIEHYYSDLFKITIDDKDGFATKDGEIILKPEYDSIEPRGFIPFVIKKDEKYGFFNIKERKIVQNCIYDAILNPSSENLIPYKDRLAPAKRDGRIYFLNVNGEEMEFSNEEYFIRASKFYRAGTINDEPVCLAAVINRDNKLGWIDSTGKHPQGLECQFDIKTGATVPAFHNGIAIITLSDGESARLDIRGNITKGENTYNSNVNLVRKEEMKSDEMKRLEQEEKSKPIQSQAQKQNESLSYLKMFGNSFK